MSLSEQITPYMAAALRAYGRAVLVEGFGTNDDTAAVLGGRLLREVFGGVVAGGPLPASVTALIADPDDAGARDALETQVQSALNSDPWLQAAASDMLRGFYMQEIEAGNIQSMVSLGDLLREEENIDGAQDAYQQAIDSGDAHAMIYMARLLRGDAGDVEGARTWFQRAADSQNKEISLEATVELGRLVWMFQRDAEGARSAFRRAISSGHPTWAPAGMIGMARLLHKQGDIAGAHAAYQQAIESGNVDSAAQASIFLGAMLQEQGDAQGARANYQRVIDSGNADWAPSALTELLNLLRDQDDIDGARAAHRKAIDTANPDAAYALVIIGQLLEKRGDATGARAAFQEAADSGYEFPEDF